MQENLCAALKTVSAYRSLLTTPTMQAFSGLLCALYGEAPCGVTAMEQYAALFQALADAGRDNPGDWFAGQLRYTVTPYAEAAAQGRESAVLAAAARRDVEIFSALCALDWKWLKEELAALRPAGGNAAALALPEWRCEVPFTFESLTDCYRTDGTGMFARYRAFSWVQSRLVPVEHPDFVPEEELWGYQLQRNRVIANTRALVEGRSVNNVLLYGDAGTGKSATVKSLLGIRGFERLRLIEVHKDDLGDLGSLLRTLAHRPQKFMLFIDDLSFEKEDITYSVLKSVLEGSLEARPDNVAVYATSNRRTLVRQNFADRHGDEVNINETIQEKTSLAERFGVRIPYTSLNRNQFLEMVEELATIHGITFERDTLRAEAIKWEMRHSSRTPRTALQFLASLSAT